jgi:pimeloyl-ACP methyl ester carboxylesterase
MFFRQLSVFTLVGGCLSLAVMNVFAGPDKSAFRSKLETCELAVPGTSLTTMGECGWIEVAENPDEPEGRQIKVRIARVPAQGRVAEPDPLVFFAGGPGQAATESWPIIAHALRKVNENRDILLVDQRGTGQSNPLKCPEMELDEALAQDWDQLATTTRECLESL